MTTPEQNLWVAVIAQQFTDATREIPQDIEYKKDSLGRVRKIKSDKYVPWKNDYLGARAWLDNYSEDFRQVCFLAGVDYSWVKREWDALQSGEKIRGEKKKYKRSR